MNISTFSSSGKSAFLENILDPATEPVSIPDDVMSRHIIKSDTISANIVTDTNPLMFVANLNRPSSTIGTIIKVNGTAPVSTVQEITTSQTYNDDFSGIRHISSKLGIVNNTISTTNFTVAGTANGICYQGKLHELLNYTALAFTVPDYSELPGRISSAMDKAVSMPLSSGITMLSLPDSYSLPYTNLPGGEQVYTLNTSPGIFTAGSTSYDDFYQFSTNITAASPSVLIPMTAQDTPYTVEITTNGITAAATGCVTKIYTLGGTTVDFNFNIDAGTTSILQSFANSANYIVAVRVALPPTVTTGNLVVKVTVANGDLPGFLKPTHILRTSAVPTGSNIVMEGIKNSELIPDASLARNLATKYPVHEPNEMAFVKLVMANRDKLRIRSVMPTPVYEEALNLWREYANNRTDNIRAEALDILPLLNTIRRIASPIISTMFPAAAPILGAVNLGLDSLLPVTDSAVQPRQEPQQYRQNYRAYAMDTDDDIEVIGDDEYVKVHGNMLQILDSWDKPEVNRAPTPLIVRYGQKPEVAVTFPVVLMSNGASRAMKGVMIYAAVPGNLSAMLGPEVPCGNTKDGFHIYGYTDDFPYETRGDITLLPTVGYKDDALMIPDAAPWVSGTSCQAAIYIVARTTKRGVFQRPITGSLRTLMNGTVVAIPNVFYPTKNKYVKKVTGQDLVQANITPESSLASMTTQLTRLADQAYGKPSTLWPVTCLPTSMPSRALHRASAAELPPLRNIPTSDAYNFNLYFSKLYPQHAGMAEVAEWMVANNLIGILHDMSTTDPSGMLLRTKYGAIKDVLTGRDGANRGPTQEQALDARAQKLLSSLQRQYPMITKEWIIGNNYAGPTTEQAKYIAATSLLPPPGEMPPTVEQPTAGIMAVAGVPPPIGKELATLGKDYLKKIESRIANDGTLTPAIVQRLRQFGQMHRRAPSTTEFNALKGLASGPVEQRPKGRTARFNPLVNTGQNAPAGNVQTLQNLMDYSDQSQYPPIQNILQPNTAAYEYTMPPSDMF